jgi:hypothetical protein
MPKDPFIRVKFTKLRQAAKKLAAEYFERYPKPVPDRDRELAPSATGQCRVHDQAATRTDRLRQSPWLKVKGK